MAIQNTPACIDSAFMAFYNLLDAVNVFYFLINIEISNLSLLKDKQSNPVKYVDKNLSLDNSNI